MGRRVAAIAAVAASAAAYTLVANLPVADVEPVADADERTVVASTDRHEYHPGEPVRYSSTNHGPTPSGSATRTWDFMYGISLAM